MTGVFKKKRFWDIWCLLCGLFLMGLFIFLKFVVPTASNGVYAGVGLGAIISVAGMICLLFNRGAYLKTGDNRISAKYHLFGRLNCSIDEVAFVLAQSNTLMILLKNGKRHVIMGVENSMPLSSAIRRQIFKLESEAPETVRLELEAEQAARKKELFWTLGGVALMLVNIFIAVFLTGGRELYDFSKLDRILFAMMGAFEVLTVIATFYAARRCGRHRLPIEQLKYRLKGACVVSQSLPSGNAKRIYTDENYMGRIILCGYPNDESVYYHVQVFVGNFQLKTVHTSVIFENEDDLPNDVLFFFIEITESFQQLQ